jgi:hypothetical protein
MLSKTRFFSVAPMSGAKSTLKYHQLECIIAKNLVSLSVGSIVDAD